VTATSILSIVAITLALTPSVLYATYGEIIGQRAGIVNLGIEGVMLMGGVLGFAGCVMTGNPYLGLAIGAVGGVVFNMLMAALVVWRGTNQLATGFAVYFLGASVSMLIGEHYNTSSINGLGKLAFPGLSALPDGWGVIFNQDLLVWLILPTAVAVWWVLFRTRWGLKLRAVGEDKDFAYSAGIHTRRVQTQAMIVAGMLYGLAGAELFLAYTQTWQAWGTAGRGFIAIAIVIFALYSPFRAIIGALVFCAATAIWIQLASQGTPVSPFVLQTLPYLLTILVVLAWGRAKPFSTPAGLKEVFAGTAKSD
jgi:general nucleoside transport system permease protein